MVKNLRQLAEIFSGYTFRSQLHHDDKGDTHVIQFRDVEDFISINKKTPVKINSEKMPLRHFLTNEDVLFLAKSQYNYAIPYQNEFARAIASSSFLILRVQEPKMDPNYLAWYINQSKAQHYLQKRTAGTYISNIAKTDLESLPVPVPELEIQQKIIKIINLLNRENELLNNYITKKYKLINHQLLQTIGEV